MPNAKRQGGGGGQVCIVCMDSTPARHWPQVWVFAEGRKFTLQNGPTLIQEDSHAFSLVIWKVQILYDDNIVTTLLHNIPCEKKSKFKIDIYHIIFSITRAV